MSNPSFWTGLKLQIKLAYFLPVEVLKLFLIGHFQNYASFTIFDRMIELLSLVLDSDQIAFFQITI